MKGLHLKAIALATAVIATPMLGFSAPAPGVTLLGMGGPYLSAWADGMMPLRADANSMIYSDLQLQGNTSDSGMVSLGSGYRKQSSDAIWGAYLFYDRERSSSGGYYNVASPGVEYLTTSWKYRLNYYAPFGTKTHMVDEGWADEFGNYSYVQFKGHEELDQFGYQYESLSYGGDIDMAYRFQTDNRWEVSLSPYAFDRKEESTLIGGNIKLSYYEGDYATLFIGDGYDNASHNRVFVGASFNLSGRNNDNTLSNLMISPVYRNLDVNTTSDGLAVGEHTEYSGVEEVEEDDIYFIDSGSGDQATASQGSGTFEDPYTNVDSINSTDNTDANFWVADSGSSYESTDAITLVGDQTLEGRSSDYMQAASGSDTPTIVADDVDGNVLVLAGDNTVSHLTIKGNGAAQSVGIRVDGNAVIDDVTIGTSGADQSFQTGVELTDGAAATITDSTINAYSGAGIAVGVKADSNNELTVSESTVSSITEGSGSVSRAVEIDNESTATIINSVLNGYSSASYAYGLYLYQAGDVAVVDSSLSGTSTVSGGRGAYSVYTSGDLTIVGSTLTAQGFDSAQGVVEYYSSGELSVSGTTINATASDGDAIGVRSYNSLGSVTISSNVINVESEADDAYGVEVFMPDGTVTITDNTFDLTASTLDSSIAVEGWLGNVVSSGNEVNKSIG